MPAGAGNPPNIKMEPPKSNFNIREGGAGLLILGGRDYFGFGFRVHFLALEKVRDFGV